MRMAMDRMPEIRQLRERDILGLFQRVAKEQNKTPEKKESSTDAAREEPDEEECTGTDTCRPDEAVRIP